MSEIGLKLTLILIYNRFYSFIIRSIRLLLVVIIVKVFKKLPLLLRLLLKLLL
jgi:hypothetical protein